MAQIAQPQATATPQVRAKAGGRGLESVRIALESLRANKLRTLLTMLGIIIGVWSVVTLLALGTGAQDSITGQISSIGTNLLSIQPGSQRGNGGARTTARNLTLDDAVALRRSIPEAEYVTPEYQGGAQVVAGAQNINTTVIGVEPEYAVVRNVSTSQGQFITNQMVESVRSVAVLGSKLAEELYGTGSPIGQTIRIKGQQFKIIGVLKESSAAFGGPDNAVMVPISKAQQSLFGARTAASSSYQVSAISVQVRDADKIDLAQSKIENLLRKRHKLADDGETDDFTVFNQATLLDSLSTVTTTLTIFLGAIAGISLLVGGIGVMNIMLVSVTERTKEIGLRKAVGAKRRDILSQFLTEALVISVLGGLVGLTLGMLSSMLIGALFSEYITPVVTIGSVVLSVSFSAAVGLFFGIYPAQRAARLNPIQALRYD